jgi:type II secretory pathway component PulC
LTASGSERGVVQKAPTAAERGEILQRVPDPESEGPPPALRVSGIVWSEDSSQRVAVINGMPLSEGDSIEGVKVVQILPTRVRFLQNESPFEILLGSAAVVK